MRGVEEIGVTVVEVLDKLEKIAAALARVREKREGVERLLDRLIKLGQLPPLPSFTVRLERVWVPEGDISSLLREGVRRKRKSGLVVEVGAYSISFIERDKYAAVSSGAISLRDLLKLAVLEQLNPGLLDRVMERVVEEERGCAEVLERLKSVVAVLRMALE